MYKIVYTNKCTDCGAETPMDYFAPDGETCVDCVVEDV